MATDLAKFLRARLDEGEAAAKAAAQYPGKDWTTLAGRDSSEATVFEDAGSLIAWIDDGDAMAVATHIALHDPRRVLRDVEAKRAIVDMHADCGSGVGYCDDGGHGGDGSCGTLRYLAAVFSGHPDYCDEWKP